jgi:plastocyanin
MNRRHTLGALALIACFAAACGSDQAAPTGPTATPPPAGDLTIDIAEINGPNSFYPSPASVRSGDRVLWFNSHNTTHHVVFDELGLDVGTVAPGTTTQPFMIQEGTWHYHCAIHPEMTGAVTVAPAGDMAPPATGY